MTVDGTPRRRAAMADPDARAFLRKADPVLARLIDERPDFRPRAWMDELPPLDAFASLVFGVAGQQLSVRSTRAIISRLQQRFGGHMPSPAELHGTEELRDSGFSARKSETFRALAQRFADGRLSEKAFSAMTDQEIEAALTDVPGIGPWTARGFLLVALNRPDVFLTGDLALRAGSSESTRSTTCRRTRSWSSYLTAGGRTGAWLSVTYSRLSRAGSRRTNAVCSIGLTRKCLDNSGQGDTRVHS